MVADQFPNEIKKMRNAPIAKTYYELLQQGLWYGAMVASSTTQTSYSESYTYPLADVPIVFDDV